MHRLQEVQDVITRLDTSAVTLATVVARTRAQHFWQDLRTAVAAPITPAPVRRD